MSKIRVWRTPQGVVPAVILTFIDEAEWKAEDLCCATFIKPDQSVASVPVAHKIMDCGYDQEADMLILGLPFKGAPVIEKWLGKEAAELYKKFDDLPIWDKTAHVKWVEPVTSIG